MINQQTPEPKPLVTPRQFRAVRELLDRPCTVRHLLEHAGGNGIPQLIATLRSRGLLIVRIPCEGKDRDGRMVRYCKYELQPESFELAKQLLTMENCK